MKIEVEICVDSIHSAIAAEKAGAQRIELCSSLSEGGLTPSAGFIEITRASINIDLYVLIRPRRGDFLYSDQEFEIMKKDIEVAKMLGANGLVLGILMADGQIDIARTATLIALATPLSITFHRAFDMTPDPFKALEDLKNLKVDRLLTSGQQSTALAGMELLRKLVRQAGDHLTVMPGGGINETNINALITGTGASAYHASARTLKTSKMDYQNKDLSMSGGHQLSEYENLLTDEVVVDRILKACKI